VLRQRSWRLVDRLLQVQHKDTPAARDCVHPQASPECDRLACMRARAWSAT
jgi:hypothetical protein